MDNVNPEFLDWEQQDQLLLYWLLSLMSEGILSRMVNCENPAHVWRTLERYFAIQIQAKVFQFKTQLRNTRKDSLTMNEYLLKIRGCIDLLGLIGHLMSEKKHIDVIFEGLSTYYDTVDPQFCPFST